MARRTPSPSQVGAAAVTVLSAGLAAAVTLVSAPPAVTAAPQVTRLVATYEAAPAPVVLSFPAPEPVEAPAPAAPPPAPAAPAPAPLAPPPKEPAPVDARCSGDGWQERRGQAALERLRRPADARAVEVRFLPARSDVLGLAHLKEGRLELFVRSCERQSDALVLHVLAHELGHLRDVSRLDDDQRAQWKAARGIPAETPWFGCDGCTDFATPAGDFAEVYAQWQRGARSSRSQLAPAASAAELDRLAARFFPSS